MKPKRKVKVYQELIQIIRGVLSDHYVTEDYDWEAINDLAKRHRICGFVYETVKFKDDVSGEVLRRIRNHYYAAAGRQSRHEHYAAELFSALRKKEIPYAPLKGISLRRWYPKSTLRMSGDLDVLCRPEHRDEIFSILLGYGFRRTMQSDLGDHYVLDHVEIHIHFSLRVRQDELTGYYDKIWERMVTDDGLEHHLTPEDEYVYLLSNMHTHFAMDGVGIRSILDIHMMQVGCPDMNRDYVVNEFRKIGIYGFSCAMEKLAEVWFGDTPTDDDTILLGKFIAGFGTPDYAELMYASGMAEQSARDKQKYRTRRFFVPSRVMKKRYPILRKWTFLLPAFWVGRALSVVFVSKKAREEEVDTIQRRADEMAFRIRQAAHLDEVPGEWLSSSKS